MKTTPHKDCQLASPPVAYLMPVYEQAEGVREQRQRPEPSVVQAIELMDEAKAKEAFEDSLTLYVNWRGRKKFGWPEDTADVHDPKTANERHDPAAVLPHGESHRGIAQEAIARVRMCRNGHSDDEGNPKPLSQDVPVSGILKEFFDVRLDVLKDRLEADLANQTGARTVLQKQFDALTLGREFVFPRLLKRLTSVAATICYQVHKHEKAWGCTEEIVEESDPMQPDRVDEPPDQTLDRLLSWMKEESFEPLHLALFAYGYRNPMMTQTEICSAADSPFATDPDWSAKALKSRMNEFSKMKSLMKELVQRKLNE
jgi:hypothetical protein